MSGIVPPWLTFLRGLADEVIIISLSPASWETKYELIFSDRLVVGIRKLFERNGLRRLDYCDPDGGYDDDVKAYCEALTERMDEYAKIWPR